jgi:hypothetical protein
MDVLERDILWGDMFWEDISLGDILRKTRAYRGLLIEGHKIFLLFLGIVME